MTPWKILALVLFIPAYAFGYSNTDSHVYTSTATGSIVYSQSVPVDEFSLQVTATGAVTSWTVVLEGSLNCSNFTTIVTHDSGTSATGVTVFNGPNRYPVLCWRTRATAVSLGGGTAITAIGLGISSTR